MTKSLAIECIETQKQFVDDLTAEAIDFAISALKKQSRIINVTDSEGVLLASISDKDIIEENGVHVIISEEDNE